MRFIVLIILVVLAIWLIRRALRATRNPVQKDSPQQQELVRCARCGVHLPRAEAQLAGGLTFCGEEHARMGAGER
jgi:uncharacterized protein